MTYACFWAIFSFVRGSTVKSMLLATPIMVGLLVSWLYLLVGATERILSSSCGV